MSELVKNNKKIYAEVYKILVNLTEAELSKIPSSLIYGLKTNMDYTYNFYFDINKPLEYQNISNKTKLMLAVIFRDYLSTEKQREKILNFERTKELQLEQEAREKYDIDVFKNKRMVQMQQVEENIKEGSQLVKYEEKWYTKIFNNLKNLINKFKRR